MKLYQITDQMTDLFNQVDLETGELPSELLEVTENFKQKGANVVAYCLNLSADVEKRKEVIKKLQDLNKADERRIDWFKGYLRENMSKTGITKIESFDRTFTAKLYPERDSSIDVYDESLIPKDFKRVKYEVDKRAVKKMIDDGIEIPGARLVKKDRLEIK